jgi:hypothetical protein
MNGYENLDGDIGITIFMQDGLMTPDPDGVMLLAEEQERNKAARSWNPWGAAGEGATTPELVELKKAAAWRDGGPELAKVSVMPDSAPVFEDSANRALAKTVAKIRSHDDILAYLREQRELDPEGLTVS